MNVSSTSTLPDSRSRPGRTSTDRSRIEVLLGIWAMRRPEATLALLITVIGLWAVLTGNIYCVLAFEIRRANQPPAEAADGTRRGGAEAAGSMPPPRE